MCRTAACRREPGQDRRHAAAAAAGRGVRARIEGVTSLAGASAGEPAPYHYVVETDIAPEHEAELNAWYEREHLPGLAAVPGTVRATRWRRSAGSPLYLACYDIVSPDSLQRPEWLAVRHTKWGSRVRPTFRNRRRTMFRRA